MKDERFASGWPPLVAPRPTRVRYMVLAVACALAALTYVQRQGFVAGTPYIQTDLGLRDDYLGYLLSGWLLAYAIGQVPLGLLGDFLGARLLLTLLVLGWSVVLGAVALIALLPGGSWEAFPLLFGLRSLFGLLQAGGFPGLARVTADWIPPSQRGAAQGLIWTFSRLGGFVAPLLVGLWLFPLFAGWAIPFVLLASLGLVWCVGFFVWFRNRPADMPQVNEAERQLIESSRAPEPVPSSDRPAGYSSVALPPAFTWTKVRSICALCLMYGFLGFSGNFFTNWLPGYLKGHRHLSPEATAWLSGLPLAFGIVSCLLGGVASDWIIRRTGSQNAGRRVVGCVSMLFAALLTLVSIWVDEVWLLALTFSTAFFFNDAVMGPAWASCADVAERATGTLSGAMNMTGGVFAAVAMSFAGVLFDRELDDWVFITFACSYAVGALCWLAIDVTRPLEPMRGPSEPEA